MKKRLFLLVPILLLVACWQEIPNSTKTETDPVKEVNSTPSTDLPSDEQVNLTQFFLPNDTTAYFKGEGNEYASYTLKILHLYDNYITTLEDNGGTVVQRIYRISDDEITLISEKGEAYDPVTPSLEELESMQPMDIYLDTPIQVGTEFNGWKITSTSASVVTDLKKFENVVVIERKETEGNMTRKYFAKDFGEIKREFIMLEEQKEVIISSTIEKFK